MNMNEKTYPGARLLVGVVEFAAWVSILGSTVMGFVSIGDRQAIAPSSFWFTLALAGLGLAAVCRVGIAVLDIAQNSWRTVQLLQRSPESAARQRAKVEREHPDAPAIEERSSGGWPIGQIEIYRGHVVSGLVNRVFANDRYFDSVEEARAHLDTVPPKDM